MRITYVHLFDWEIHIELEGVTEKKHTHTHNWRARKLYIAGVCSVHREFSTSPSSGLKRGKLSRWLRAQLFEMSPIEMSPHHVSKLDQLSLSSPLGLKYENWFAKNGRESGENSCQEPKKLPFFLFPIGQKASFKAVVCSMTGLFWCPILLGCP